MKVIRSISEVIELARNIRKNGNSLGLVPTMGCLHEGHRSLIKKAVENNDKVIVSIFVNPIQFGPDEDYETYPRTLEADTKLCEKIGADYIFHPDPNQMYPEGFNTFVVPSKKMTNILCGASRPGHFRGVCTVLTKLFTLIKPDRAYFGEKDIQQLAIVKRMVNDLNFDIEIIGCPIIREDDGLAKSSRNTYLNEEERAAATVLRRSILEGKKAIDSGNLSKEEVLKIIKNVIEKERLAKIDYVEIIDFDTFDQVETIKDNTLIAMAVYIGKTRLIDNMLIKL